MSIFSVEKNLCEVITLIFERMGNATDNFRVFILYSNWQINKSEFVWNND